MSEELFNAQQRVRSARANLSQLTVIFASWGERASNQLDHAETELADAQAELSRLEARMPVFHDDEVTFAVQQPSDAISFCS